MFFGENRQNGKITGSSFYLESRGKELALLEVSLNYYLMAEM